MRKIEWKESNLYELCLFIRGVTFGKSDGKPASFKDSIPVLRAGNIQERLDIENDLVFIPSRLVQEEQLLQHKDIVICLSSGSAHLVGKTAQLDSDFSGTIGAFCGIVRPKNKASAEFLKLWFKSDAFWSLRDSLADGASIQNLKFSQLENKKIKIPVNEQEIIDFSYELQNQLAFVESMRQAALKQKEAAKALQSAILREVFPWQAGEFLPDGWRWEKVGKYAKFKNGLNYSSADIQAGIKIVGVSSFLDNFFLDKVNDIEIRKERVREEDYLKKNDILIVRSNGSADLVGRHLLYIGEEKVTHSGFTIRLRLDENEIHPLFYMYFARSDFFKNQTRGQGANIKNVSQAKLSKVDIPLPKTVENQLAIVESIQKKITSTQKTMGAIENQLASIDALPAAILREAFNFEKKEK